MITRSQFSTFEELFDYYNQALFNAELPDCMINMSRKKGAHAFFAPGRWKVAPVNTIQDRVALPVHEISMNPDTLHRSAHLWHSTLVHEMCHLWRQEICQKKGSIGYHDKEWGNKMEELGLMPSNTGEPGGKKTGQKMTHYIIPRGPFDLAFEAIKSANMPYVPAIMEQTLTKKGQPRKQGVKIKYTCACGNNVWGKDNLKITCDECDEAYERA